MAAVQENLALRVRESKFAAGAQQASEEPGVRTLGQRDDQVALRADLNGRVRPAQVVEALRGDANGFFQGVLCGGFLCGGVLCGGILCGGFLCGGFPGLHGGEGLDHGVAQPRARHERFLPGGAAAGHRQPGQQAVQALRVHIPARDAQDDKDHRQRKRDDKHCRRNRFAVDGALLFNLRLFRHFCFPFLSHLFDKRTGREGLSRTA